MRRSHRKPLQAGPSRSGCVLRFGGKQGESTMISSVRADAKRRKLAGAAVLAFAAGGLVLSWVSAHAVTLDTVTISAPAARVVGRDRLTNLPPLQQIRVTAQVKFNPATLTTHPQVHAAIAHARSNAGGRCRSALVHADLALSGRPLRATRGYPGTFVATTPLRRSAPGARLAGRVIRRGGLPRSGRAHG